MVGARGIFYGWVIVFAGLALSMIIYGIVESFGIVFKSIALEFSWGRGAVATASMINWITFGVSSLACGVLCDRFGSRRVILGGSLVSVGATLLMSQVRELWHLYVIFGVLLAIGRAAVHVSMAVLVTRWFTRHQGLALSIAQSQNVGLALFAPLCAWLLTDYGWRGAYLWFGALAVLMVPLALLMRDAPAAAAGEPGTGRPGQPAGPDLTLGQALRTREFWTLAIAAMGCCLAHSDLLLHGVSHMTDVGLDAPVAARVIAVMAVCGMAGKIASGLLADRFGAKWTIAGFLLLQACMIVFFVDARHPPAFYLWAVLFGVGFAGPMPIYAMLFRQYFGIRSIGSLLGFFFILSSLGMGGGGLMGGMLHSASGSYALPFLISAAGGFAAFLLVLTLPSTRRGDSQRTGLARSPAGA